MRRSTRHVALVLALCAAALVALVGCSSVSPYTTDDVRKLADEQFGADTYTVEETEDPEYDWGCWTVTLNDYPDRPFKYIVTKDYMITPWGDWGIGNDFSVVFEGACEQDYLATRPDSYLDTSRASFTFSHDAANLDDLPAIYADMMTFQDFVTTTYPVLIEQDEYTTSIHLTGMSLRDNTDSWIDETVSDVDDEGNVTTVSYDDLLATASAKVKTHADVAGYAPVSINRSVVYLGSDTMEDFVSHRWDGWSAEELSEKTMDPGESASFSYSKEVAGTFYVTELEVTATNTGDEACSSLHATVTGLYADDPSEFSVNGVGTDCGLKNDDTGIDENPYDVMGIAEPQTVDEKVNGVAYGSTRVLFDTYQKESGKWEVEGVTVTFAGQG